MVTVNHLTLPSLSLCSPFPPPNPNSSPLCLHLLFPLLPPPPLPPHHSLQTLLSSPSGSLASATIATPTAETPTNSSPSSIVFSPQSTVSSSLTSPSTAGLPYLPSTLSLLSPPSVCHSSSSRSSSRSLGVGPTSPLALSSQPHHSSSRSLSSAATVITSAASYDPSIVTYSPQSTLSPSRTPPSDANLPSLLEPSSFPPPPLPQPPCLHLRPQIPPPPPQPRPSIFRVVTSLTIALLCPLAASPSLSTFSITSIGLTAASLLFLDDPPTEMGLGTEASAAMARSASEQIHHFCYSI